MILDFRNKTIRGYGIIIVLYITAILCIELYGGNGIYNCCGVISHGLVGGGCASLLLVY